MAIINGLYGPMGGPLDELKEKHLKRFNVEGVSYTEAELRDYAKKHKKEISKEAACKKLEKLQNTLSTEELAAMEDIAILGIAGEPQRTSLFIGNALLIAVCAQDYEALQSLIEKKIPLKDGSYISLWDANGMDIPMVKEERGDMLAVLLDKPEKLSEELWFSMWELYVEQREQAEKEQWLEWPERTRKDVLRWLENLAVLYQKRPELYEAVVTEVFYNHVLWSCTVEHDTMSKKDWSTMLKKWKKLPHTEKSLEVMWKLAAEKGMTYAEWNMAGWARMSAYMKLWKLLTKQPVILDVLGTEGRELCFQNRLEQRLEFGDHMFLQAIYDAVDVVKHAESLNQDKLFDYLMTDGNETDLLSALKIDLISRTMLPNALQYAEKNRQQWVFPLLILKSHGEWKPEAAYEV